MKDRGLEAVAAESEALFQKVIDQYADLRIESNYPQNAAELAKGELHVLRNLCIGRKAPDIVGKDIRGKAMRLAITAARWSSSTSVAIGRAACAGRCIPTFALDGRELPGEAVRPARDQRRG